MRRGSTGALAACVLVAATVAGTLTSCGQVGSAASTGSAQVTCDAELRSWIVAGRGRHMFLEIGCPIGFEYLDGRVEYTFASMRRDYEGSFNEVGMPRVARMTRGIVLFPLPGAPEPDNRLEKRYEITPEQAACLQQDVMFSEAYVLIGANSSAGLRAVMEGCGIELPEHVVNGGGVLGEFPGVDAAIGSPIEPEFWGLNGVPDGPTPVPQPGAEDE